MKKQDRYVIKKYIMATSVKQALEKEKKEPVQECWIDPEWTKMKDEYYKDKIGF